MNSVYRNYSLLKFTFNQLFRSYIHIGSIKRYSHPSFSFYIFGYYYNLSIINLNFSISFFRISIFFLKSIIIKGGRLLLVNEDFSKLNLSSISKVLAGRRYCFIFNRWTKGFLTNIRTTLLKSKIEGNLNRLKRMPNLVFFLHSIRNDGFFNLQEVKKLKIPYIKVMDNSGDPSLHPYWIPGNTTTIYSKFFYFNILNILLDKLYFLKKVNFIRRLKLKEKNEKKVSTNKKFK